MLLITTNTCGMRVCVRRHQGLTCSSQTNHTTSSARGMQTDQGAYSQPQPQPQPQPLSKMRPAIYASYAAAACTPRNTLRLGRRVSYRVPWAGMSALTSTCMHLLTFLHGAHYRYEGIEGAMQYIHGIFEAQGSVAQGSCPHPPHHHHHAQSLAFSAHTVQTSCR